MRWLRLLWAWRAAPELASRFLKDYAPKARCIILGHTHRPGVWHKEGRIVVNTGSFSRPNWPWAVWVGGGQMSVRKVERDRGGCLLGREVARFPL